MHFDVVSAERAIARPFRDRDLLLRAFVDFSAVPRHQLEHSNVDLAFMGDALVRVAARKAVAQRSELSRSDMAQLQERLASNAVLAKIVRDHAWDRYLITGVENRNGFIGDSRFTKHEATLFEAVIGAVDADESADAAIALAQRWLSTQIEYVIANPPPISYCHQLEKYVRVNLGIEVKWRVSCIHYGDLGQEFSAEAIVHGQKTWATAPGRRQAKEQAAMKMLAQLSVSLT